MLDTATLTAWAEKGHFTDFQRKPERRNEIEAALRIYAARIEPYTTKTTTQMFKWIWPDLGDKARLYVTSCAQYLRKEGRVDDIHRRGPPNAMTFGKPAVLWINPKFPPIPPEGTEGLEAVL